MDWRCHPRVKLAADQLRLGRVIAYPTEAVWGLGCLPDNRHAVHNILALKNRPENKGLILVAGDISQISFLLEGLSPQQKQQLEDSWPSHTTWLVPHNNQVPAHIHGKHPCVAVRVSTHPVVQALCTLVGGPIVSTSANPQGLQPARFQYRVKQYFNDRVIYVPGQIGNCDQPSKIYDLQTGRLIRA